MSHRMCADCGWVMDNRLGGIAVNCTRCESTNMACPDDHNNEWAIIYKQQCKLSQLSVLEEEKFNLQKSLISTLQHQAELLKQLEEANEVIAVYADSENDYFIDIPKTRTVNSTPVYTMKNIVQMTKLAREYQKKYLKGDGK